MKRVALAVQLAADVIDCTDRHDPPAAPHDGDTCKIVKGCTCVRQELHPQRNEFLGLEENLMSEGCKVFSPPDVPESNSSGYPPPFRDAQRKRWNRRLADYGGLKNFGVNFVRVEPGGQSSARHGHTKQDEFVYILVGEFVLVTRAGRQKVGPGTCIAFPAGTGDAHHFVNESDSDAAFLVVGDRTPGDEAIYPDIDLELKEGPDGVKTFRHKDGSPYPKLERT